MVAQQAKDLEAQKAALLSAIAQQGSAGQLAFAAEQSRREQAQKQAVQQIAQQGRMTGAAGSAPKEATQQLQGMQTDLGNVYAQDAAMSQQAFRGSIDASRAANDAYMAAAGAALPVVQAQTAGQVAQIRAEQEAQRAAREHEAKMREMDLAEAERERAFREEERAYERSLRETGDAETAEQERQISVSNRIQRQANEANRMILPEVFELSETPEEAIAYANRTLSEAQAAAQASGDPTFQGYGGDQRNELYRYIYEFYYGKPSPRRANDLGDAFAKEGIDPSFIAGYKPPAQRQQQTSTTAAAGIGPARAGESAQGATAAPFIPLASFGNDPRAAARWVATMFQMSSDDLGGLIGAIEETGIVPISRDEAYRFARASGAGDLPRTTLPRTGGGGFSGILTGPRIGG